MKTFLLPAALLGLLAAGADLLAADLVQGGPTISAPATAQGGSTVAVSGTSPGGESGTHLTARDDYNRLTIQNLKWSGNTFKFEVVCPAYNPEDPTNTLTFTVSAMPNGSAITTSVILP